MTPKELECYVLDDVFDESNSLLLPKITTQVFSPCFDVHGLRTLDTHSSCVHATGVPFARVFRLTIDQEAYTEPH